MLRGRDKEREGERPGGGREMGRAEREGGRDGKQQTARKMYF